MDLGMSVAIVAVVFVLAWVAWTFNVLIRRRTRVDEGWSLIEVELKRRYDLIPSLVAAVRGYAAHEGDIFQRVADARAGAVSVPESAADGHGAAESSLTSALRSLFAVAEAYPELRAAESFQSLQADLALTEDRIAYARAYYNALVTEYETTRRTLPSMLVAALFRFAPRAFFEADVASRGTVAVDLR
ncbi:MAG: LemA family protein [Chloroflexi bacterium]|nr:LemA family protein [Chloroflexota bacterium]MDA1239600.1 LemA family protein [Chloroflexota bacterium]